MGTEIANVILLFPLFLSAWMQGPLTNTDLVPGPYPIHVEEEKINFMGDGFEYVDYAMRTRMIQNLGRSASPTAVTVLLEQMNRETDARVQATILAQLANLPYDPNEIDRIVQPLLENADATIRYFAVNLYGALPEASAQTLLQIAGNDTDSRVRRKAAARLVQHARPLSFSDLDELRASEDPVVRADAWASSCHTSDAADHANVFLAALDDEDSAVRFAIASHIPILSMPTAADTIGALANDSHASVRGATAGSIGILSDNSLLPVLLALAGDRDSEVRRLTVESLVIFPVEAAAREVVKKYGDPAAFVREQAEETAVSMHAEYPIGILTAQQLVSNNPEARFRVYNVLGRIGVDRFRETIADSVKKERDPKLIAAAVKALYRLKDTAYEDLYMGFAEHESDMVRESAALALGNLDSQAVMNMVNTLINDDVSEVREAALFAAGQIADPFFSPIFLSVLRSTGERSRYTSRHRSYACWGAGRIRPVDTSLAQRLVVQATTPVIPVMGMRMFEPDYVLASACLALAQCAKDVADIRPLADKVIAAHSKIPSREERRNQGPNDLMPSAEVREAARQAQAYLEGRDITRRPRPTRTISMIYRQLKD